MGLEAEAEKCKAENDRLRTILGKLLARENFGKGQAMGKVGLVDKEVAGGMLLSEGSLGVLESLTGASNNAYVEFARFGCATNYTNMSGALFLYYIILFSPSWRLCVVGKLARKQFQTTSQAPIGKLCRLSFSKSSFSFYQGLYHLSLSLSKRNVKPDFVFRVESKKK